MSWQDDAHHDVAIPPRPTAPPPAPADPVRAVAVALLNLSELGLGHALVRRWGWLAACWGATAALLLAALPADPDGVPGTVLVLYLTALLAVAVHGASVGLRTRWSPPWSAWCCWRSRPGRRERPRRGVPLRGRPVPGREVHHRPLHGTGRRSFSLKACGSCTSYSLTSTLRPGFKPCDDSGKLSPGYVCTECAYTSGYGY